MTAALAFDASGSQSRDRFFGDLRDAEYSRLDADNQAYLDFTGSALYASRQILAHTARLERTVLGNPHSENGPSLVSTAIINAAKKKVLRFLDAPDDDYVVSFTANTSAAIRLVAESYPFGKQASLVLSSDNHNSMNGVREYARAKGAGVRYIGLDHELKLAGARGVLRDMRGEESGLFGFPAQSNFSGVKHPLSLIAEAQLMGYAVLLDAAAFLPASRLSLRQHPADFVALSMYKITGYPTGVGALVARRTALSRLRRPWFAGGTVEYASVQHGSHRLTSRNGEGFEDGTPAFIDIAAVGDGLDFIADVGVDRIASHVAHHRGRFVRALRPLRNRVGKPLVRIYGPSRSDACGATVAFNLIAADGNPIPFAPVVERARHEGVSLRGGCFCNPGASESAFGFPAAATARCLDALLHDGFSIPGFSSCLGPDVAVGAVRASMGIATNDRDIDRAIAVIASFG
jgi:selenocysteine lyase/cysteine desulfurase